VAYFRQAGIKAFARSAHREALACFEQALAALQYLSQSRDTTEQAIDLRLDLRNVLLRFGESGRVLDYLREAEALSQTLGDERRLGRVSWCMTQYFMEEGEHDHGLESGRRALAIATTLGDFAVRVATNEHLGHIYYVLGDYRQAVDVLGWNVASLQGERIYERYGMAGLPSVHSRAWLVRCLAELGEFARGISYGEEAVRIAEAANLPYSLSVAYQSIGFLYFRKGDLHKAIPLLEYGLELCRVMDSLVWFPTIAWVLSSAYVLSGRVAEALPLVTQALEQNASMRTRGNSWRLVLWLSEAHLLTGHMDEVIELVGHALELCRIHKERGPQAWALRSLGEILSHQDPPEVKQAEAAYREGLTLASELGMRPLLAHCHVGLGALYHQMGRLDEARSALSVAIQMYHSMDMEFWLARVQSMVV
jgi:tetratricopeptide (TPR) repeat protein